MRRESTYETLHHLKNELKANSSSLPTTLGGGNNGYLGMILTPAVYHRIAPANTFTRPPNPGVLVLNPASMASQIASAEDTYGLTKKLYLETLLLEQTTVIQKIIKYVDKKYLAALRNPVTGQITSLIPTFLNFLHNNYGHITPQQLDGKTTTLKSMTYNLSQPIDVIFNSMDNLV